MGKVTGLVFKSRDYIGGVEPPATVLQDESRWGSDGAFKSDGHPDWVQLPSGLWVMDFDISAPDYIEIPAAYTQLNFTSESFSIIAWIRLESVPATAIPFIRGSYDADGYELQITSAGSLLIRTNQSTAHQDSYSAPGSITIGSWFAVGFSRNGASIIPYKNGVDVHSTVGVHENPATSTRSAYIGAYDGGATLNLDGKMAFLRVYNHALSAPDIANIFQAERHWFGV